MQSNPLAGQEVPISPRASINCTATTIEIETKELIPDWAVISHEDTLQSAQNNSHIQSHQATQTFFTPTTPNFLKAKTSETLDKPNEKYSTETKTSDLYTKLFDAILLLSGLTIIIAFAYGYFKHPITILGFVPILIVGPLLWWVGWLKPNNKPYWIKSLIFGGSVAVIISLLVQMGVSVIWEALFDSGPNKPSIGYVTMLATIVAPIIEELTKGLAIISVIFLYKKADGILDSVLLACWAALGFTVVEDLLYIYRASEFSVEEGLMIFGARAILTPFTHVIFTLWIGIAIGIAIEKKQSLISSWWGWLVAIILHGAWNALPVYLASTSPGDFFFSRPNSSFQPNPSQSLIAFVWGCAFVALFGFTIFYLVKKRIKDKERLDLMLPWISNHYNHSDETLKDFANWRQIQSNRKKVSRNRLKQFDIITGSLTRLADFHTQIVSKDETQINHSQSEEEITLELNNAICVYYSQTSDKKEEPRKEIDHTLF